MKKLLLGLILMSGVAVGETIVLDKDTLVFRGAVDSKTVSSMIYRISNTDSDDIKLFISSPGGSVLQGSHFIDFMKASGKKFTCITDFAASMAFSIFQHCDNRYVLPSGILMQHQSSWGIRGEDRKNKQMIKLIDSLNYKNDLSTSKKLRMSVKSYNDLVAHDLWLLGVNTTRFRGYKFADAVVNAKCTKDLLRSEVKETIYYTMSKVDVVWSGCPLVDAPLRIDGEDYITTKSTWDTEFIKKINTLYKGRI